MANKHKIQYYFFLLIFFLSFFTPQKIKAQSSEITEAFYFGDSKGNISQTEDTFIHEGHFHKNFGTDTVLYVQNSASGNNFETKSLLKFSNIIGSGSGQIPAGAEITSATLYLYVQKVYNSCSTCTFPITLYQMKTDWLEGNRNGDFVDRPLEQGATWKKAKDFYTAEGEETKWKAPGIDSSEYENTKGLSFSLPAEPVGWRSIDITPFLSAWANGETNYGILLKQEGARNPITIASRNASTSYRPMLEVHYKPTSKDPTPPGNLNSFSARSGEKHETISLSWIAPGDDGASGEKVKGYEIKYSANPIISEEEFAKAETYPINWDSEKIAKPGETQSINIILNKLISSSYFPTNGYYIAVKAYDKTGNSSSFISANTKPLNNPSTLPLIELTFQYGVDSKGEISKSEDAMIVAEAPRWNFGKNTALWLGNSAKRNLIQFPRFIGANDPIVLDTATEKRRYEGIEQIPPFSSVTNAYLTFISTRATSSNVTLNAYQIRKPWTGGNEGQGKSGMYPISNVLTESSTTGDGDMIDCSAESGVTWNKSEDYYTAEGEEISWKTPGAQFADDISSDADISSTNFNENNTILKIESQDGTLRGNFFDVSITEAVKDWVNDPNSAQSLSENNGILLTSDKKIDAISSSDYSMGENRPLLTVEYVPLSQTNGSAPLFNSFTASVGKKYKEIDLAWDITDVDNDIVAYDIRYSLTPINDETTFAQAIPYSQSLSGESRGTTLRLPDLGGTNYYIAIKAQDATGNYSNFKNNIVNIASNNDLSTLENIEVIFQEGGDCKDIAITKTEDSFITSRAPHLSYGKDARIYNTSYNSSALIANGRALIKFPNSLGSNTIFQSSDATKRTFLHAEQIPSNAEIIKGELIFFGQLTNPTAYQLSKDWLETSLNGTYPKDTDQKGTNWIKNKDYYAAEGNENSWGIPGADCTTTKIQSGSCTSEDRKETNYGQASASGFVPFDITSLTQKWATGEENFGIILQGTGSNDQFYSSEYSNALFRPFLSVTYKNQIPDDTDPPETICLTSNPDHKGLRYSEASLSWLTPRSDSMDNESESVTGYELRYSTKKIIDDKNVDCKKLSADQICYSLADIFQQNWIPEYPGKTENYIVNLPLLGGTKVWFSIKSYDENMNYTPTPAITEATLNNNLSTLSEIEITFQEGDGKGNISETKDTNIKITNPNFNYAFSSANAPSGTISVSKENGKPENESKALVQFPNFLGSNNAFDPTSPNIRQFLKKEQIPQGAPISEAHLILYNQSSSGDGRKINMYTVKKDWLEGTEISDNIDRAGETGVTWMKNKDYYTAQGEESWWGVAGGDCTLNATGTTVEYPADAETKFCKELKDVDRDRDGQTSAGTAVSINTSGRYTTFDVTRSLKDWADPTKKISNYGWLLARDSNETGAIYADFYSSENIANTLYHPLLSVTYKINNSIEQTDCTPDNGCNVCLP